MPNSSGSVARFKKIGVIAGAIISILTLFAFGVKGVVWAADQRYSTHKDLNSAFVSQRIQTLDDVIFELELKVQYSEATNSEKARLSKFLREREALLKGN